MNLPDLVLFVGEALVGTEAVDQLSKFNQALVDYSDSDHPRTIDGIVLSKFDTIDDKACRSPRAPTPPPLPPPLHIHGHPVPDGSRTEVHDARVSTFPFSALPLCCRRFAHTGLPLCRMVLGRPVQVGASISMTYTTGQPIVFVGTGQDYGDLKKLHVKSVVASLLK